MIIGELKFQKEEVFERILAIPDSFVVNSNKIDTGRNSHGEAKFYIASKEAMRDFFGGVGFSSKCFFLKADLLTFLESIRGEYLNPSQKYRGGDKFTDLLEERRKKVERLSELIEFSVQDQVQIEGDRGYVNSSDTAYQLLRELSLPLVTYLQVIRLREKKSGTSCFYFKLFVDFDAIYQKKSEPLVFSYGKTTNTTEGSEELSSSLSSRKRGRDGQAKYRASLLDQCPYCPFTKVSDDRLLIASHIKPWSISTDREKLDPYNGFMFTPTYDYLFDKGYITFTPERKVCVSDFLSAVTCKRLSLKDGVFLQDLPYDAKREKYLQYHREFIFKGKI